MAERLVRYSLILCTYNQARSLALVLDYLSSQVLVDSSKVEVIIIDNNSSDETKAVCEAAIAKFAFSLRYVFEGRQGLSVARNRGVNEAQGEYLIFTDDDARLPPNWLQAIIDAYEKYDADCIYGKIIIDWVKEKPFWYCDRYQSMFVGLDYGEQVLVVQDLLHEFYGKNFSLKKQILVSFGGFDENLGRKGDRLFIGEETKIYRQLINGGYRVIYVPSVSVFHMLKDHEYTQQHFEKHYRDATVSTYFMLKASSGKRIFRRPAYVIRKLLSFAGGLPMMFFKALLKGQESREWLYLTLEYRRHVQLALLWLRNPDSLD